MSFNEVSGTSNEVSEIFSLKKAHKSSFDDDFYHIFIPSDNNKIKIRFNAVFERSNQMKNHIRAYICE